MRVTPSEPLPGRTTHFPFGDTIGKEPVVNDIDGVG
jgi:hypothetical protein